MTNVQLNENNQNHKVNAEELAILRWLYRYPEVVAAAGQALAPHLIATYVYELAARFNTFYNKHQILPAAGDEHAANSVQRTAVRLQLTQAVANVLKSGLGVMGIAAPGEM